LTNRRTDRTNRRVPGAAGYRTRRGTRTALAALHDHCRLYRRSRSRLPFVRRRTPIADRRVATPLVIKHFDVLEQLPLRFVAAVEPFAQPGLHGREQRLQHRVVVTIPAPAHTAGDSVRLENRLVIGTGVRAASVGMMQQPAPGTPK